jgi:hypothetical protein
MARPRGGTLNPQTRSLGPEAGPRWRISLARLISGKASRLRFGPALHETGRYRLARVAAGQGPIRGAETLLSVAPRSPGIPRRCFRLASGMMRKRCDEHFIFCNPLLKLPKSGAGEGFEPPTPTLARSPPIARRSPRGPVNGSDRVSHRPARASSTSRSRRERGSHCRLEERTASHADRHVKLAKSRSTPWSLRHEHSQKLCPGGCCIDVCVESPVTGDGEEICGTPGACRCKTRNSKKPASGGLSSLIFRHFIWLRGLDVDFVTYSTRRGWKPGFQRHNGTMSGNISLLRVP